jgi:hypothetical protein
MTCWGASAKGAAGAAAASSGGDLLDFLGTAEGPPRLGETWGTLADSDDLGDDSASQHTARIQAVWRGVNGITVVCAFRVKVARSLWEARCNAGCNACGDDFQLQAAG